MIKGCIYDVSGLENEELFRAEYEKMPAYRKEKTDRMRPPASKRQSLGAGILINLFLREYGLSEEDILFGESGKPLIRDDGRKLGFSVSHAENLAVIAYGEGKIGIDIEGRDKFVRFLPEMIYSERELSYIKSFPQKEQPDPACRIWVVKEAATKAEGTGITDMMSAFNVIEEDGNIQKKVYFGENGQGFNCMKAGGCPEGFYCYICSDQEARQEIILKKINIF